MRKILFTISLASSLLLLGQEAQFSQYFESKAVLNPAFIGTNPLISLSTNYNRTGSKSNEAYLELMQASISYPLKRRTSKDFQMGGVGVTFWKESRGFEGLYTAQKVLLTGAYSIKLARLSNQKITFGLQGGVVQNQINGNSLEWGSQFSRYIGFDNSRDGETVGTDAIFYPAINFGVIYSTFDHDNYFIRDKSLIVGASVDYLNRPEVEQQGFGVAQRSRIYRAFGSFKVLMAPRLTLNPSGYILYSDGNEQVNAGVYLSTLVSAPRAFNAVVIEAGGWYRLQDSFILLAGMKINDIRIGVSADLNATSFDVNEALGNRLPTFEISLSYNFHLNQSTGNVSSPIF
ncbi:MAG: hypothetical protein Tsb0034_19790 [Ekhidna sp.]